MIDDGGPAFPAYAKATLSNKLTGETSMAGYMDPGMSLRAYFAGLAMKGLIEQHRAILELCEKHQTLHLEAMYPVDKADLTARHALIYAHALIAELKRDHEG